MAIQDGSARFEVRCYNKIERANTVTTGILKDINIPLTTSQGSTSIDYTGSTSNHRGRQWYTIISSRLGSDTTQLGIPVLYNTQRVCVRGESNNRQGPISTPWKELAYLSDVQKLQDKIAALEQRVKTLESK